VKILTVIGARPQFIKAAAVSHRVAGSEGVEEVLIHTGQHFDPGMSEVFFNELGIPEARYNLGISSLSHGAMTGRMLEEIEKIVIAEKPDWMLVYGDTNSTLAGALAASKLNIPVAHVEAGLRSANMRMPEEQNRILTDNISKVLFCPTDTAMANLTREGFGSRDVSILNVGDVMLDVVMLFRDKAKPPAWFSELRAEGGFILSTVHRAENTDGHESLSEIIVALNTLHRRLPVVMPVHPRTRNTLAGFSVPIEFYLVDPVSYLEMVYLLANCSLVATDSGGLQKEAYFQGKPCITLREQTEWTELVSMGVNRIVGTDRARIVASANDFLDQGPKLCLGDAYGDGRAAEKIVSALQE